MPGPQDLELVRAATLCLVDRERTARGERELRVDPRLQAAAQGHTESMAWGGYFEHLDPSGQSPLDRMRAAGYVSNSTPSFEVGENLAWGTGSLATPAAIVGAWMASPDHRANILDARFRDTAVGVSAHLPASLGEGQQGGIYTEDFGGVGGP